MAISRRISTGGFCRTRDIAALLRQHRGPLVYRACKLGIYLDELADMGGTEAANLLSKVKLNNRYRNGVFSLLKTARLAPADIPAFARAGPAMTTRLPVNPAHARP
jgi:hypothetical protein